MDPRARPGSTTYRTGPFVVALTTDHPRLLALRSWLYAQTEVAPDEQIVDFNIEVSRPVSVRRWYRPQILFRWENIVPFQPYPLDHAFPLLEWGLNWCIAMQAHQYLMLHAAVVEREGFGLVLPALPGAGKSTLCAGLAHSGWRLLSDEFGLVRPATLQLLPLPRAVPLKNQSIGVIREFTPEAHLGPTFHKTRKGTVAHMSPPADSLQRQQEPAEPRWVVFPRYLKDRTPLLQPIPKSLAFTRLAHNSFNYRLLGATGYRSLTSVIRSCDCYSFEYGDLRSAAAMLNDGLFR